MIEAKTVNFILRWSPALFVHRHGVVLSGNGLAIAPKPHLAAGAQDLADVLLQQRGQGADVVLAADFH